jgi:hypothetical protein
MIPSNIKHLRQLKANDRFCFVRELRSRKVWQVVEFVVVTINEEQKLYAKCINDKLETKRFDGNRTVMFLRNSDPEKIKSRLKNRRNKRDVLIDY